MNFLYQSHFSQNANTKFIFFDKKIDDERRSIDSMLPKPEAPQEPLDFSNFEETFDKILDVMSQNQDEDEKYRETLALAKDVDLAVLCQYLSRYENNPTIKENTKNRVQKIKEFLKRDGLSILRVKLEELGFEFEKFTCRAGHDKPDKVIEAKDIKKYGLPPLEAWTNDYIFVSEQGGEICIRKYSYII